MSRSSRRRGEDLHDGERQRDPEQHEREVGNDLRDVGGQDVGQELADVLEHRAPLLDRRDDGGEVVVEQHHVGGAARNVGAHHPHRDADVRALQRRCVVDAIAGDGDDVPLALQRLDDAHLLVGGHAGEQDLLRVERELELRVREAGQRVARDLHRRGGEPDVARYRARGVRVVAGHHDHANAGQVAGRHRLRHFRARRVVQPDDAGEL